MKGLGRFATAVALLMAVVIIVFLLVPGQRSGGKTLIIATSVDYPPFSYEDERGQPAGFDYEYGTLLCQVLDAKCEWQTDAFEQVFDRTRRGEFDLAINSFTRTEFRERLVGFSDPYYRSYGQFIRRAGSGAELDESSLVAVQSATIYERYLNSPGLAHIATISFENQVDAFQAVADARADLTIADDVITDLAINQSPFFGAGELGKFERVGEPVVPLPGTPEFDALGSGEIGIIVPLQNAGLLPAINRAIVEINGSGALAQVSRDYFGRDILAR
ncbi:MAG: transporter substrate-binding domain-containing protein [Chloroflexota bacterium]|nr:transporter substrate-binding domain-containing protein [Chloroflexota bacterium]